METTKNPPRALALLGLLGLMPWVDLAAAEAPPEPLTSAAAVLSLDATQARQRLKVAVTGVVTAAESDWRGQFFLQDSTGGVFVENYNQDSPSPGDLVAVTGVSHPGAFAPIIGAPQWRKLGTAPLPVAKTVSLENLMSGVEDGQRIEVTGLVRAVSTSREWMNAVLAVGGYRLQVRARIPNGVAPESLVAARVRVRGTTAAQYNPAVRHLISVAVYVPTREDFTVLEPEAVDPFAQEAIPLDNVAQYRRASAPARRVHVLGTVTKQRAGEDIFIHDDSGGLRIETAQPDPFALGDQIEAVGFLEYEGYLPVLRDAILRKTGRQGVALTSRMVTTQEIRSGSRHADLITVRGKFVDRSTLPVSRQWAGFSGVNTTWLMQGEGGLPFTVEYEDRGPNDALAAVPVGSTVEVDGVCLCEIDAAGKFRSFKLLLLSPAGVRILEKPSWLTPGRLLLGLGVISVLLVAVALWSLTVSRKNAALGVMNRELGKAQRELQDAHDTLEQKVIERSAQLQTEMTAKKTAEVQFKAVLMERTRLARDLHDTLEQTLTGIALHLDTAAKIFERDPAASNHHFQLARNWLQRSQVGLRGSIWDLRSRELEQFDLASALRHSAEQLIDGTAMELEFTSRGEKRVLPEVVEENVLRIGQEALTNIGKHAQATRVGITVEFGAQALLLKVEDNGVGFEHSPTPSPGDNHFGLLGVSERVKRLGGRFVVDSRPGRGTSIQIEVPLESIDGAAIPAAVEPEPFVI